MSLVSAQQDLSSFAMPFLEGDAELSNKDSLRKVTQLKYTHTVNAMNWNELTMYITPLIGLFELTRHCDDMTGSSVICVVQLCVVW